jgi:hydroxymethylpyrimidine pyrophosphatase-like HAD family hydrolase
VTNSVDSQLNGLKDYRPAISSDGSMVYNFPTIISRYLLFEALIYDISNYIDVYNTILVTVRIAFVLYFAKNTSSSFRETTSAAGEVPQIYAHDPSLQDKCPIPLP